MQLSVCMIVKDEEANLPACLTSVRELADEIILVDTGSQDRTIAIARQFDARIHTFEWCDDFAAARNESLTYAAGDWILILDADEALVPAAVPSIRQVMQSPTALSVLLLRQEVGAEQAPYSLVSRLFRNRADIRFTHPYHELVDESVAAILQREPDWRVVELPEVALRHTGYQADAIAQRHKTDRARRIMERWLQQHPDDPYIGNKLGALYAAIGEVPRSEELLKRALAAPNLPPPLLYELYFHLASNGHEAQQQPAQVSEYYQSAMQQPIQPRLKLGAYIGWGNLLLEHGDVENARRLYTEAVKIDPSLAIAHYNLGMALRQSGDLPGAIGRYQQAIALKPDYAEAYQNLGVALLKLGKVPECLDAFSQAIHWYEQRGSAEADRLRQALREMGFLK